MIVAGIDVGSSSAKAVIIQDDTIVSSGLIPTGADSTAAATDAMEVSLKKIGLKFEDVDYTVSTGYGRVNVPFANKNITEISCHAKGTMWFFPEVRTILDMGGQDCKVIRCDESGKIANFVMNDKCAAGTGRYLERVAKYVKLPLMEIGERSLKTINGPSPVDSYCTVFAENDILMLIREGHYINDILAGAIDALADRIIPLIRRVGLTPELSISGGVAKNIGVVRRLENKLGMKACIAPDPQAIGATGAALFARAYLST